MICALVNNNKNLFDVYSALKINLYLIKEILRLKASELSCIANGLSVAYKIHRSLISLCSYKAIHERIAQGHSFSCHVNSFSANVPTEDYALWLDLVGLTQFAVLDECLGEYRFYSENISNKQADLQYKKGNEVRLNALMKYLNIQDLDKNIWDKFLLEKELNTIEVKHINYILPQVINTLSCKGYTDKDICNLFKNHFRKLFYHVRSVLGQWLLLTSPLNSYFGMKIYWRLFCFVCRGLCSINKGSIK